MALFFLNHDTSKIAVSCGISASQQHIVTKHLLSHYVYINHIHFKCGSVSLPASHFSTLILSLSYMHTHARLAHTHYRSMISCQLFFSHKIIRNASAFPCRPLPVTLSQNSRGTGVWFGPSVLHVAFFCGMCLTSVRHTFVWRVFDVCFLAGSHLINTFVVLNCLCQMLQVKYPQCCKIATLHNHHCWRHNCCLTSN